MSSSFIRKVVLIFIVTMFSSSLYAEDKTAQKIWVEYVSNYLHFVVYPDVKDMKYYVMQASSKEDCDDSDKVNTALITVQIGLYKLSDFKAHLCVFRSNELIKGWSSYQIMPETKPLKASDRGAQDVDVPDELLELPVERAVCTFEGETDVKQCNVIF